jgi:hypothetical protein
MKVENETGKSISFSFAPDAGALDVAPEALANALSISAGQFTSGNVPILRMLKDGTWCYGQESMEVQPGAHLVVNPFNIAHGYQIWRDKANVLMEERWTSIGTPAPVPGTPMEGARTPSFGYKLEMQIVNGEDKGITLTYRPTSHGGKDAASVLMRKISAQVSEQGRNGDIVPVVTLDTDDYNHKIYGKTYVPVIEVISWLNPADSSEPEPVADAAPDDQQQQEAAPPTTVRRRTSVDGNPPTARQAQQQQQEDQQQREHEQREQERRQQEQDNQQQAAQEGSTPAPEGRRQAVQR